MKASRSAARTAGLITYMRTDGVQMAEEAYAAARSAIGRNYGKNYLPDGPRRYTSKAKNAQEAHEAVRPPTSIAAPAPDARWSPTWRGSTNSSGSAPSLRRWKLPRSSAPPSKSRPLTATPCLRATGQVVKFDGFLTLYQEGKDESDDEDGGRLPTINQGDTPKLVEATHTQHFTEPPPRYSEASLVKKLEELGIGRPSTYASTLSTLIDRDYVKLEQKRFIPRTRAASSRSSSRSSSRVTSNTISPPRWKKSSTSFPTASWRGRISSATSGRNSHGAIGATAELRVSNVIDALNEVLAPHIFPAKTDEKGNAVDPRKCPTCGTGELSLKLGKFGAFIGCSNYPECRFTRPFGAEKPGQTDIPPEGKVLGNNPDGVPVFLKSGRFGAYVQLGPDPIEKGEKPRRSSIPNGWSVPDLDLEQGLKLSRSRATSASTPRMARLIMANLGRYGPYVKHLTTYANVPDVNELFEIGINRAVTLIAEKRAGKGGGRGRAGRRPAQGTGQSHVMANHQPFIRAALAPI